MTDINHNPFENFIQDDIDELEDAIDQIDMLLSEKNPDHSRYLAPVLFIVDARDGNIYAVTPKEFDNDTNMTLMRTIGSKLTDPSLGAQYLFEGDNAGSSHEGEEDAEGTQTRA